MNTELKTIRDALRASIILLTGILLSGIIGNIVSDLFGKQPAWKDIETYASHFRTMQMLTFWFGFIMIIGFLWMIVQIYFLSTPAHKTITFLAIISATLYAALISVNYILQLAVLQPAVKANALDGMELLAFPNPRSVTMAIEMLGYAFQGIATLLIIPFFDTSPLGKTIKILSVLNGLVSIAGMIIQGLNISLAIDNPLGKISFYGWNILFAGLCICFVVYFKRLNKNHRQTVSAHQ